MSLQEIEQEVEKRLVAFREHVVEEFKSLRDSLEGYVHRDSLSSDADVAAAASNIDATSHVDAALSSITSKAEELTGAVAYSDQNPAPVEQTNEATQDEAPGTTAG